MQFNISINQKAFQEIAPNCDLIDAAIFDFIRQFMASGRIKQKEEDGNFWYWLSHQKIIDELPMIGIKSRIGIYNRLEKLIDAHLLKRCPSNKKHSKSYFGRGEKFDDVIFHKESLLTKMNSTVNENEQSTVNENEHNHNTNKDHSTKENKDNPEIEEIYQLYPRHVGKKKAIKKIEKAIDDIGIDELKEKVKKYAKAVKDKDRQFIPYPATWFNQGRYLDDPAEWVDYRDETGTGNTPMLLV